MPLKLKSEFLDNKKWGTYLGKYAAAKFNEVAAAKDYANTEVNNSFPYDFMTDFGDGLKKVQVKGVSVNKNGSVRISVKIGDHHTNGGKRYILNDVDFFAVYVVEYHCFYLIPAKTVLDIPVKHSVVAYDKTHVTKKRICKNLLELSQYRW